MSAVAGGAPVRVAVLGAGTVGSSVVRLLHERAARYAAYLGRPLEVVGVAVRDLGRQRDGIDPALLTTDAASLVEQADVVVEVMGGIDEARRLIEQAMRRGAQVVTANKQLIAQEGVALEALAAECGVGLDYEAAVMAAIPVMSVVREALAGDEITSISGVVNGSTNFILDLVARKGVPFEDAVRQAGELGYLEADPTEDLEGLDAAAKIVILARTAWGLPVTLDGPGTRPAPTGDTSCTDRGHVLHRPGTRPAPRRCTSACAPRVCTACPRCVHSMSPVRAGRVPGRGGGEGGRVPPVGTGRDGGAGVLS